MVAPSHCSQNLPSLLPIPCFGPVSLHTCLQFPCMLCLCLPPVQSSSHPLLFCLIPLTCLDNMALAISAMFWAPAVLLLSFGMVGTTDAALPPTNDSSSLDGFCELCQSIANQAVFAVRLGLVTTKDATELVQ